MAGSSDAGRPQTDLARIGLCVGYELGNRFSRNRWIDHHDEGEADDPRAGPNVAKKAKFEPMVGVRIDRVCRTYHEERVAVGRRIHDPLRADIGAGSRAVFYDELLPEPLREPRSDQPRENVG